MLMGMSPTGSNVRSDLPAIDERLIAPNTGYEIEDGKLVKVAPSDPEHASNLSDLAALLTAHRKADRIVAIDMLTRLTERDDLAPDASVYPSAPDPVTGGRQIEELVFEVLSTERLGHAGAKAAKFVARGVRRVFAIDVTRQRAFEWSHDLGTWEILSATAQLQDSALAVALPIAALVDAGVRDSATVKGYRAQRHPEFLAEREEGDQQGHKRGHAEGRKEALLETLRRALVLKFGVLDPEFEARIATASSEALDRYFTRVFAVSTIAAVFEH